MGCVLSLWHLHTRKRWEWRVVKWVISFINYLIWLKFLVATMSKLHRKVKFKKTHTSTKQKGIWRPKHVRYNHTKEMRLDVNRARSWTKHPACIPIMDKAGIDNHNNYSCFSLLLAVETASSCSSLLTISHHLWVLHHIRSHILRLRAEAKSACLPTFNSGKRTMQLSA